MAPKRWMLISLMGDLAAPKKSKKEIMEELIRKSKLFKAERQMQKEQDEDERERLDDVLQDLLRATDSGLKMRKTRAEEKEEMMQRLLSGKSSEGGKKDDEKKPERDAFDTMALDISREARAAAASNRTKTAEEIAKEDREELERLEQEREARMRGRDYVESDDDLGEEFDDSGDEGGSRKRKKRKRTAMASGDDSGNLLLDPEYEYAVDAEDGAEDEDDDAENGGEEEGEPALPLQE